jgi:lipoprotein-releasing system ATP-binding protein
MPPTLEAKKLSKTFSGPTPVEVLTNVSLSVAPGESVAITGASGEGKSTLLHILGTLESPTNGSLHIGGSPIPSLYRCASLRNSKIGFVFQSCHLLDDYTVLENVLMPARIARQSISPCSPAHTRATSLLKRVGLNHRSTFLAKLLSGGEKQRVAIARALCNNPTLLLADEPSGNLDHTTSQHIHSLLLETTKKEKKSLIVMTHDHELANLCDTHYLLQDGTLHQQPPS